MTVEKYISKTLSIFFRLIIILFGIYLVWSRDNYFKTYWYFVAIAPYITIYLSTLFREGLISRLRLLNDYIFIVFFLYDKTIDYTTICYLILPIINSPNHTGNKKSIWLYIFFVISLYVINDNNFNWSFIFVTLIFITINFIIDSKTRYFKNITALNLQIEEFFENELELRKSYKFYVGILAVLNKIKVLFLYKPKFQSVVCFRVEDDRLILENSSTFIWSYDIDSMSVLRMMNQENHDNYKNSNIKVTINDLDASRNFIIFNQTKKSRYAFVFVIKDHSNALFNLYYLNLLKPITARISRFLDLERTIHVENKLILRKFRDKFFHMQNAEKAMHFIRNRFNTLDNFIEMSKDNIAGKMDAEDLRMYSIELQRLERNYELLMERVSNILNKPDKPFSATQLEKKSPNYLYGAVRGIWLDYFSNFIRDLNWNVQKTDSFLIEVSHDGLYIILTDWISNLQKYSKGNERVIFNEDEDNFFVVFINEYNPRDRKSVV